MYRYVSIATPFWSAPWSKQLTDREAKLGRTIAGGHVPSVAKADLGYAGLQEAVIQLLLGETENECAVLCKRKAPSLFRKLPVTSMMEFQWEMLMSELHVEEKAPLLLQIMSSIIVSTNDHHNQHKVGVKHYPGICMATGVLLKERNRQIHGIQSLLSLLLFLWVSLSTDLQIVLKL